MFGFGNKNKDVTGEMATDDLGGTATDGASSVSVGEVSADKLEKIYKQIEPDYMYSGGFARACINIKSSFIGQVQLVNETEYDFDFLSALLEESKKDALLQGKVYLELFLNLEGELEGEIYKETEVKEIIEDDEQCYLLSSTKKIDGKEKEIKTKMTPKEIIELDGDTEISRERNPYGFVPVIPIINGVSEKKKESEVTPLLPYLKTYTKVMNQALLSHKNTKVPKLLMKLKDWTTWIKRNFTKDEIKNKSLDMSTKNVIFAMDETDTAEYIEPKTGGFADTGSLLKMLFYNIVVTSGIPEFVYGTHVKSSNASVGEQKAPIEALVNTKRAIFMKHYKKVYGAAFKLLKQGGDIGDDKFDLEWVGTDEKITKDFAESLSKLVVSLDTALSQGMISHKEATQTISNALEITGNYTDFEEYKADIQLGMQFMEELRDAKQMDL